MCVIARRDNVADVDVDIVVRVDLDAASSLVLPELLAALLLELRLVGVAVVVERTYLVDSKEALGMADVTGRVSIEMDYGAVLELASTYADQVIDTAVNRSQREVQKVGIDLVRIVYDRRQRDFHLTALTTHDDLATIGLRHGFQAAVAVHESIEGVAYRRIVGSGGEQPRKPHALDERREHIARLTADGEVSASQIGEQALACQNTMPGAALAQN